jgi:hypothetical protein
MVALYEPEKGASGWTKRCRNEVLPVEASPRRVTLSEEGVGSAALLPAGLAKDMLAIEEWEGGKRRERWGGGSRCCRPDRRRLLRRA